MDEEFVHHCLCSGNYLITRHARDAMYERGIALAQIEACAEFGEMTEREPYDFPFLSALLLGWLESGDPVHIKCSRKPGSDVLRIVTVYEPDEREWMDDHKTRKRRR